MTPSFFRSVSGFFTARSSGGARDPIAPANDDIAAARAARDRLATIAVYGEIGGVRPRKEDRATSWWGGNFLGAAGEAVPVCARSGRAMHPVVQVRVDELPEIPPAIADIALLTLWLDLEARDPWGAADGEGFRLRAYPDLGALIPLGPGYRESAVLPTFPILWRETALDLPGREDNAAEASAIVARFSARDHAPRRPDLSFGDDARLARYPIKLGGWPQWIQGSQWPEGGEFVLQADSTEKGRMLLGDAGSLYVFRTGASWALFQDCF